MSRRRRFQLEHRKNSFALNITSMTDMFTILLVFLLQTYSTSEVELNVEKNIRLPSSNSTANPIQGVKLSITNDAVKLGDKTIVLVKNKDFESKDLDAHDANFVVPLFKELDEIAKKAEVQGSKEGKLLLQADASLPYQTIRRVMYTASMAGFPQLKLVTVAGE